MTAVYLVPYHSEPGLHLGGSTGQFAIVEKAIDSGDWHYDNGDDPSFYVARKGGLLTWGVCRQDVRNAIKRGSIVVFFSYTSHAKKVRYRLSAVATVADTVDRRIVFSDSRFQKHTDLYLNVLIKPEKYGWKYEESDRAPDARHSDWLWRIAVHDRKKASFKSKYKKIYETGRFSDGDVLMADNYVVFSGKSDETYIALNPPKVAKAIKDRHDREIWDDSELRLLTVGKAGNNLASGRDYLRVANRSGRNVHRQIRFKLPSEEAIKWRKSLISLLQERDRRGTHIH